MHWEFADIHSALLELAPMAGGTDVGIDLDDPRNPFVSLALPQSVKGIQGKDLLAWHPGLQELAVVIDSHCCSHCPWQGGWN